MPDAFPQGIEPAVLWKNFDLIRSVPRGSGEEAALRAELVAWAIARHLDHVVDAVGNLVIRVPGTPGREAQAPIVLQGHIDMVCEKNSDVVFDFATQGIEVELDGEWLKARGTTLGADNGIGVAAAMALADDPTAVHGPLEILCTIDEETGMTGAFGLDAGLLQGRRMLNLDTEEEGAVYVGCAGGGDVVARFPLAREPRPLASSMFRVEIKGLVGGHSGLEIHLNRANAIKCLGRVLDALAAAGVGFRISKIEGGSKRNAIPREAGAGICLDEGQEEAFLQVVQAQARILQAEFVGTDPEMQIQALARPGCECAAVFTHEATRAIVRAIVGTPSCVLGMSRSVPGLVETSNNLGVVRMADGVVEFVCCSRSSVNSALQALRRSLLALYEMAGGLVELDESYPGWNPNIASPLLALALAVHKETTGVEANVKAVHAGLECGLIGERFPGMDMISIGPEIRGAHSPDERVQVPSVVKFYDFLKALLAGMA